jgi:hypothetical protein
MNSLRRTAGVAVVAGALVAGCSGDVAHRLASDSEYQAQVIQAIGQDPVLTGIVLDRLLAGDARPLVMERVLGHSAAMQDLMTKVARDRTALDGVINLAVQDSTMRSHIMTLFKGMQMMDRK